MRKKYLLSLRYSALAFVIFMGLLTILGTSGDEIQNDGTSTALGVNTLPAAAISSPADSSTFSEGALVTFAGSGTDTEDGTLFGSSLVWTSSRDGRLGIGGTVQNVSLSSGTHTITLTATDSGGGVASQSINITLNPVGNTIPTASIGSPSDSSSFSTGDFITFTGTGTDTEDGSLSGTALVWNSNIDGQLGTGNTLGTSNLSPGTHKITLSATDYANTTGTASITITIGNSPPTAVISSPATGSTVNEGESVNFSGTGTDTEDGDLTGNSLVWYSNKNGIIGTGKAPIVSDLASGSHTITLKATDSQEAVGSASITLTVANTVPTAAITSPSDGDTFLTTSFIEFTGTGTDTEDGNLYGSSLSWTSSIDGHIGSGTNFTISGLTAGSHTITLTATDKNGSAGTATIDITVN